MIVSKFKKSRPLKVALELGLVTTSVVGPAVMYYMPCLVYNHPITLCIVLRNSSNFSYSSFTAAQHFYGYTHSLLTLVIAVIVVAGTSVLYCTNKLPRARRTVKKVGMFCIGIVVYLILQTTVGVVFALNVKLPDLLTISLIIINALSNYIIIIGILLTFHFSKLCDPLKKLVKKKQVIAHHYYEPNIRAQEYGTFRFSSRRTAASTTYFNVPYTGEFTAISKT